MLPLSTTSQAAAQRCMRYRRRILDISQKVSALHIAPAFSCLEIVDCIYHALMTKRDTFVLSKGHGVMAQYAVLEELGKLPPYALQTYCTKDGMLGAHPDLGVAGIAASTGSLGHGLGMAVGMALAERIKLSFGRIYVVISDGELMEGSTWEAIMQAAALSVNNLTVFVDNNDFQSLGRTSETHPLGFYPLKEKFEAFGWRAVEIGGHKWHSILNAGVKTSFRPIAVICKTVKGRGVSFMENVPLWHYRSPSPEEYQQAIADLEPVTE